MISIFRAQALNQKQSAELNELYSECSYSDKYSFSDEDEYFFLYEDDILSTVLTLFYPDENTCECKAYSKKAFRRKGNFTVLMNMAKELISAKETVSECKIDFLIAVPDEPEESTVNTLSNIAAKYYYSEYIMDCFDLQHKIDLIKDDLSSLNIRITRDKDKTCHIIYNGIPTGIFSYDELSSQSVYFYDYYIAKEFRKKGYGHLFFKYIMRYFASAGINSIKLQVSELNIPAMSIYKKAGFLITDTLSFYKY